MGLDITLDKPLVEVDTAALGESQSLYFYSGYLELVKLIDTLERSSGIGKISALQVKAPKSAIVRDKGKQSVLRLDFKGIEE